MSIDQKAQAISEFLNLLAVYDLIVAEVKTSGQMVRCKALGDTKGKKSGAYFFKPDFPFNYYISNFRTGDSAQGNFKHLKDKNYCITKKTAVVRNKSVDYESLHIAKAKLANNVFTKASLISQFEVQNYGYLARKQIFAFGIKSDKNDLLIPGYDINGKLWMYQRILPNGSKLYISGSKKNGLFHKLGLDLINERYSGMILVTEGYATGASIHQAIAKPTVVAFDAGNLEIVGRLLRSKYKSAKIVFCMDCDYAGIYYGIKAATATNGCFVLAVLPDEYIRLKQNDFNDVHCLFGLQEIINQIYGQCENMELTLNQAYKLFINEITLDDIETQFHDLAHKYVTAYYVIDYARETAKQPLQEHSALINRLNPKYQDSVVNELIKILAANYFIGKLQIQQYFLEHKILEYINNYLIDSNAKKICELESLEERRAMLAKINPVFITQVKHKLDLYWQELQLLKRK